MYIRAGQQRTQSQKGSLDTLTYAGCKPHITEALYVAPFRFQFHLGFGPGEMCVTVPLTLDFPLVTHTGVSRGDSPLDGMGGAVKRASFRLLLFYIASPLSVRETVCIGACFT